MSNGYNFKRERDYTDFTNCFFGIIIIMIWIINPTKVGYPQVGDRREGEDTIGS